MAVAQSATIDTPKPGVDPSALLSTSVELAVASDISQEISNAPDLVPASFGVCILSTLNPIQALKILAKDFEPYWRMTVHTLLRVRSAE